VENKCKRIRGKIHYFGKWEKRILRSKDISIKRTPCTLGEGGLGQKCSDVATALMAL